ncbi:hypothetical protein MBLNU230_g5902t1 [Neophaeotheca triangularis]
MRDRRNTNLSTSSTSSSSSSTTPGNSPTEKTKLPTFDELPTPVTKENNRRRRRPHTVALKVFGIVFCLLLLLRCLPPTLPVIGLLPSSIVPSHHSVVSEEYNGPLLPDEPKALMVTDAVGRSKWTVSIPPSHTFPLSRQQYQGICSQGEALRESIKASSPLQKAKSAAKWQGYYADDPTFVDVGDAQRQGLLPKSPTQSEDKKLCERSLTFSMATEDASFGKSLLMLWLSYGMAKKEGRAFFIDDTDWPYGRYSTFFEPAPDPNCAPPPRSHILPCPRTVQHLVVSASTASQTFNQAFYTKFQNPRKHGAAKNKPIYDLLRTGYEALFRLNPEDATYAASRIKSLRAETRNPLIGMHIRRGDLHPLEIQFSSDYLPLERYTTAARSIYQTLQPPNHYSGNDPTLPIPLLLASDDPELYTSPDLLETLQPPPSLSNTNQPHFTLHHAQSRIQLATKTTLDAASPRSPQRLPGSAYIKHIDENSGWEGGFYSALLFSAGGRNGGGGSGSGNKNPVVGEQVMRMRELVARAYLLDLAVLGQGADGVVCAVGSAGCRVLGVMGGWEAVVGGRWRNVDDGRGWSWEGGR